MLLVPAYSAVLPHQTDTRTRLTRDIPLNIPLVAAAMDTVTEAGMAIAMAQAGGIGVVHKNLSPEDQAAQVRRVKKFESGMVVNPVTIHPDQTLADVRALQNTHRISGIPVVERGSLGGGQGGRLVGIITNRDVRFATDPNTRVYELMTRDNLVTAPGDITPEHARALLHKHRIEKLLVVDEGGRCVGLITVKDMDKAQANPHAVKDALGRLRVAAASGVGEDEIRRRGGADRRRGGRGGGWTPRTAIRAACWPRWSASSACPNAVQAVAGHVATPEGVAAPHRRRRRCGEDRHRARRHLHHARRRRASACRSSPR